MPAGAGRRYLIQHSAGSGKSNSIAWLAHQLVGLEESSRAIFDSVVVVTDRRVLDRQINATIKQFAQVSATPTARATSGASLPGGRRSTLQKFPFVLDDIGDEHRGRSFAIIVDEAHSGQGGRTSAAMSQALAGQGEGEEETPEDAINRAVETRGMLPNTSYFATPKNKTLQMFGESYTEGDDIKHRPFHGYTMKQAIQEGFILDVLKNYTPVESYYRLIKRAEARSSLSITLSNEEGKIGPVPPSALEGRMPEPEFDCLLVAQALVEEIPLLSKDPELAPYPVDMVW